MRLIRFLSDVRMLFPLTLLNLSLYLRHQRNDIGIVSNSIRSDSGYDGDVLLPGRPCEEPSLFPAHGLHNILCQVSW